MFVGEWNNNDYIVTKSDWFKNYRRVWMKYEQNKYLPIYVKQLDTEDGTNSKYNDFSQCYEDIKNNLKEIPHLYVYNPTS